MTYTPTIVKILIAALALPLWVAAGPAFAQETSMTEPVPTLSVRGSGEVRVEPDVATVRLGIETQNSSARVAQKEANANAQRILDALKELGVPEDDVRTSRLRLTPIYENRQPQPIRRDDGSGTPKIVAYRAENVVTVRLTDLSRVGPVLDAGLGAGANQVEGVSFGLENDLPAREEALRKAVAEARSKAKTIAEALEVAIVGVLEVQEGGVSVQVPRYQPQMAMMRAESAGGGQTPVAAGQITVSADVTLRYRIE